MATVPSPPEVIYDEELRCVGEGTALFQPDPYDEYPILELGDGGYTMKGKFVPRWRMPGWDTNPPKPVKRSLLVPEPLHSRTVREIKTEASVDLNPGIPAIGGVSIQYACSTTRGALLLLHDKRMESRDLDERAKAELELYALENLQGILDECGLRSVGRLAIITGTTMTGNWDAVVFSGDSQSGSVGAKASISSLAQINASISVRYSRHQMTHRSAGHLHSPGVDCTPECATRKNQCVFIRRLYIGSRMHRHLRRAHLSISTTLSSRSRQKRSSPAPSLTDSNADSSLRLLPTSGAPASESELSGDDGFSEISSSTAASTVAEGEEYDSDDGIAQSVEQEIFDWIFENSEAEKAVLYEDDIDHWSLSKEIGLTIDVDMNGTGRLIEEVQDIISPQIRQLESSIDTPSMETDQAPILPSESDWFKDTFDPSVDRNDVVAAMANIIDGVIGDLRRSEVLPNKFWDALDLEGSSHERVYQLLNLIQAHFRNESLVREFQTSLTARSKDIRSGLHSRHTIHRSPSPDLTTHQSKQLHSVVGDINYHKKSPRNRATATSNSSRSWAPTSPALSSSYYGSDAPPPPPPYGEASWSPNPAMMSSMYPLSPIPQLASYATRHTHTVPLPPGRNPTTRIYLDAKR